MMIGFIVKHGGEGLGKIHDVQNGRIIVDFLFPPKRLTLATKGLSRPVLTRAFLSLNTTCETDEGRCHIQDRHPASTDTEPHKYGVEFENGLTKILPETHLTPVEEAHAQSPLDALAELELEGYGTFQKREALAEAWWHLIRSGLGVKALLASRIDLRPHQAYVAGTVLLDRKQRYLLADEVGLGKTIEAGIVIHDLISRNPTAKVLIICPGALSQQWLCELYSKFSGKVFQLLDLRNHESGDADITCQAIVSFSHALTLADKLVKMAWDLVVIDEAHHLLGTPKLYQLAQQLSKTSSGCLLLSAIPAQHREDEYLRLLALLEPLRYNPNAPHAREHFKALYSRQIDLGRKLSYISRRLSDFVNNVEKPERIISKVEELITLPVLAQDETLHSLVGRIDSKSPKFVEAIQHLLHHVGDRYRINRRILRNRRSQLLEIEPDLRIARRLNRLAYSPEQLELDARSAVRQLLLNLQTNGHVADEMLVPFARQFLQALSDPISLITFLSHNQKSDELANEDQLALDAHISYADWPDYVTALWKRLRRHFSDGDLELVKRASKAWHEGLELTPRFEMLLRFLRASHKRTSKHKFLIFAGFPGLAQHLAAGLTQEFKEVSVAQFLWQRDPSAKEKDVQRFRRDEQCWLLVSDETGGEGRNFQFAHEIIHYDLPWHISKVEQRIGRLDRLGRKNPDVCSNALFASSEEEAGLLECMESGFGVFQRSISGLEFALKELERRVLLTAITDGYDGMGSICAEINRKAEAERAEDDVQGMLDAASLERSVAESFLRVQSTPARDIALEQTFCDYFKFAAGTGGVRFKAAGDFPEGIVEFRPDQLKDITELLRPGANGRIEDRLGTFRREIAQVRPDLEFFTVGNDFFDAICGTLRSSTKGRSYALECVGKYPAWRGFEFSYRTVGHRALLAKHPGLANHLDRIFTYRLEHCFITENCEPAPDHTVLLKLRKSLKAEDKDRTWWNFTTRNTRIRFLEERYVNPGWGSLVNKAEDVARTLTRNLMSEIMAPALEFERARIGEQIRQSKAANSDDWQEEIVGLELLLRAINEWDLELDIVGFLSVNGGITQ